MGFGNCFYYDKKSHTDYIKVIVESEKDCCVIYSTIID
jgi:hypothetical protein